MLPSRRRALLACACALLFCACAAPPAKDTARYTAAVRGHAPEIEKILTRLNTLRSLPPAELQAEYARLAHNDDTLAYLSRALLLSLPAGALQDSEQALALLDGYLAQAHTDDSTRALALLVLDFVTERSAYEQRLKTSQKRIETLQQQLEELKSIETSINRRDQPEHPKRP